MLSSIINKKNFVFAVLLTLCSNVFAQKITDAELKKNVVPLENSLQYIAQLEPQVYEFNKEKFTKLNLPSGKQFGFNADAVQRVLPEIIVSESQFYPQGKNNFKTASIKGTDLESLIPLLVGSIKEQQLEIENLKKEVEALKQKQ